MGTTVSGMVVFNQKEKDIYEVLEKAMKERGYQLVEDETEANDIFYILSRVQGNYEIFGDSLERMTLSGDDSIIKAMTDSLNTKVLSFSMFDGSFVFLTYRDNEGEESKVCLGDYEYYGIPTFQEVNKGKWIEILEDEKLFNTIFQDNILLPEDGLVEISKKMNFSGYFDPEYDTDTKYETIAFKKGEGLYITKGEPIFQNISSPIKLELNIENQLTYLNMGGPTKGVDTFISSSAFKNNEITIDKVLIEYNFRKENSWDHTKDNVYKIERNLEYLESSVGPALRVKFDEVDIPWGVSKEAYTTRRGDNIIRNNVFTISFIARGDEKLTNDMVIYVQPLQKGE